MRILYLHSTGAFGGASRSLLEVCKLLSSTHELDVITPRGSASDFFARAGMRVHYSPVSQFAVTRYGYYRGLRWLVFLREIVFFPITFWRLRIFLNRNTVDVVHLNEVTLLMWSVYFKRRGLPVVLHVRSVYKAYENTFRDRFFAHILRRYPDSIVVIDETVGRSLPPGVSAEVIHNSLGFARRPSRRALGDCGQSSILNVGIVANFLRVKGHYEFIKAAELLIGKKLRIKFHIVGASVRRRHLFSWALKRLGFYDDVETDIRNFVRAHNMDDHVVFYGLVEDIVDFYSSVDLLCFPSYYDAPGRPVFEAAYFGVPSIVAVKAPTPDTIVHGQTGLVIDRPCAQLIAEQIERLYLDRGLLSRLGAGARALAETHYSLEKNVGKVLAIYNRLVKKREAANVY